MIRADGAGLSIYLETLVVFLLLLVDYTEAEVDFVGLLEIWLHLHDLREGLLGMIKRTISIIQDTYAVPKLGFLERVLSMRLVRYIISQQQRTFGLLKFMRAD